MALSEKQVLLIDILTDRIVTIGATMAQVKTMNEEQIDEEIGKWEQKRSEAMEELEGH